MYMRQGQAQELSFIHINLSCLLDTQVQVFKQEAQSSIVTIWELLAYRYY